MVATVSVTRIKIIAAESTKELEHRTNLFLSQGNIELKQLDYQTDGYEQPYSVAILYHEKAISGSKSVSWRDKILRLTRT
ncbi:hypothetical protein CEB3_c17980 [Peptococcaceae bacterium CEB3]|nr:hypothetical protein CEB3_c17980 [Peptococcaceae bacterium CEB3]